MSKPTIYKSSDFDKPKVAGLAVHNAKLARVKAEHIREESKDSFRVSPETSCYVLWGVAPDCTVFPIGGASVVADFQPLIRKTNLAALAAKYKDVIGFVTASEGWAGKDRGKVNYTTIAVPAARKGGAK
jgi:hypothetical protein